MTDCIIHIESHKVRNPAAVTTVLNQLSDGKFLLTFRPFKRRSDQQNRYYHGCVIPLVKEGLNAMGYRVDDEETHEFLKLKFLTKKIANEDGEFIEFPGSTKKLTTVEFNEFIESVIQFGSEFLSITIPYPNESLVMFNEVTND